MVEIIKEFISKYNYQDNNDVLEIIFYGSSKYNTNNASSDIDLLIISSSEPNQKGVAYIRNKKIEFHIKNIDSIIEEIDSLEESRDTSLLSIFQNGEPLLKKTSIFEDIKRELQLKKSVPKKRKNRSEVREFYERYKESSGNIKSFYYHNTLETIRKKYQEENGYSKVQSRKVKMLFENRDYARKFYCVNIPNEEFTSSYLNALIENERALDDLYNQLSYKEGYDNSHIGNSSKRFIVFYSTHISSELEKLEQYVKEDIVFYNHFYYIVLEKIRKLYANKVRIDIRINCFPEEYENRFLELFYECINTKSIESIYKLFRYTVDDYKIDYRDYKVLEY